jgi:hypothetical protein
VQKKNSPKRVIRTVQWPTNAERWVLELACGHEVGVTSKTRPTRKNVHCDVCAEEAAK